MKDDGQGGGEDGDEGGGEDVNEGGGEGSDEGVMKVILSWWRGLDFWQTDKRMDICDCRVASTTEK